MNNLSIEIDLLNNRIGTPAHKRRYWIVLILMIIFASAFILTRFQFIGERISGGNELNKSLFGVLMMTVLTCSGALILYFQFNKPKKGSLVLSETSVTFKIKGQIEETPIEKFHEVKLFIYN